MKDLRVSDLIELCSALIMTLGLIGVFLDRIITRKGLGARVIQLLAIILLVPSILILSLEKVLTSEAVAALIGGLAGYLLSDIGRFEPRK